MKTMRSNLDKMLFLSTFVLMCIGIIMVYSTSYIVALDRFGDGYLFFKRQLLFGFIGLLTIIIVMRIPYELYGRFVYPIMILSLSLLVLLLIPGFGVKVSGAKRWLRLGTFSIQPSEIAKLSIIIYLSYFFSKKGDRVKTFKIGVLPPALVCAIFILLIVKEPDFGSALSVGIILVFMMFIGGVRMRYLISAGLFSLPLLYFMVVNVGYRWNRIKAFINPWSDPERVGFQVVQSLISLGSGGIVGKGLGQGEQKLFFLPEAHTDFIFSVTGEELGFIGLLFIIVLYMLILWAGWRVAMRADALFGTYLAAGITTLILLQAIMNMGVATGLLPPKGLPLPFISYGGTSLLVNSAGIGILINIYNKSHET